MNYPQFRVLHGKYGTQQVEVYVAQAIGGPESAGYQWGSAPWGNPHNYPQFPYAYVVGNGSGNTWNGAAAALAAVTADYNAAVAARDAAAAPSQDTLALLPDSPVLGPG